MKRVSRATFALMVVACTGLFGASFLHAQGAAEQPMLAGKTVKKVTKKTAKRTAPAKRKPSKKAVGRKSARKAKGRKQ